MRKKEERKSHLQIANPEDKRRISKPRGQKEDLGLYSHTKSQQIHYEILRFFGPLS
jgi:hypothetical protein